MSDNLNSPREYDAVLGQKTQIPAGMMVLGGLAGVKQRLGLGHNFVTARIAAAKEAVAYGQAGLKLLVGLLCDPCLELQEVAYVLLRDRSESFIKKELLKFNFYRFFGLLGSQSVQGSSLIGGQAEAIATWYNNEIGVFDRSSNLVYYHISSEKPKIWYLSPDDYNILIKNPHQNRNYNTLEVWEEGELKYSLAKHQSEITATAISSDGKLLATGGADGIIIVWDINRGKPLITIDRYLMFGTHRSSISNLAFSLDNTILVSSAFDHTIKVWDIINRQRLKNISSYNFGRIAISCDGLLAASYYQWNGNSRIGIWFLGTGDLLYNFELSPTYYYRIKSLLFSPNGRVLVMGTQDGSIQFWSIADKNRNNWSKDPLLTFNEHKKSINNLAFTPDGSFLLSSSEDQTIKTWGVTQ